MDDEAKRRANFRPMMWLSVSMLCGIISMAVPLLSGGDIGPLRTLLLILFSILFVISVTLAARNRPPR